MSGSFFDTIMVADARTNPNNRAGAQFAAPGSQQPRWSGDRSMSAWASVHVNAETAIQIAAQAVADTPMDGLTGDHPEKRHHVVTILDAVAHAVRCLALDADGDHGLLEAEWSEALRQIAAVTAIPFPLEDNHRRARVEVITETL